MSLNWADDETTGPALIGLMAGINIIGEVLVSQKIISAAALTALFQTKIDELHAANEQRSDAIAEILEFLKTPQASAVRQAMRKLTGEPEGNA